MIEAVFKTSQDYQNEHAVALKEGFQKVGVDFKLVYSHEHVKSNNVCFWGWRAHVNHVNRNKIIIERGYLGDRFNYSSIATNGLNGFGEFWNVKDDASRFDSLFSESFKPWNPDGDYILIAGQTPNDASLRGIDLMPWYTNMAKKLKEKFNLPVHFRQHPNLTKKGQIQTVPNTIFDKQDFHECLNNALLVVTFNSNTGVDALLAGKPTYVHDSGGMAYNIANNNIDNISLKEPKDRKKFFDELAWKQYTIEEIANGECLKKIRLVA